MSIQAISGLRLPQHNKDEPIGQPMMKKKIQLLNAQMWLVTIVTLSVLSASLHAQTPTPTPTPTPTQFFLPIINNFGPGKSIGKYDGTTGAAINTNFITGLMIPNPVALALSGGFGTRAAPFGRRLRMNTQAQPYLKATIVLIPETRLWSLNMPTKS